MTIDEQRPMTWDSHRHRLLDEDRAWPRVLHVDHSTSTGGAELALRRVLEAGPEWTAALALPRSNGALGAFESLRRVPRIAIHEIGAAQFPGASDKNRRVRHTVEFGGRVLAQAMALRSSRPFRSAAIVHANTSRAAVYSALACSRSSKPFVVHLRDLIDRQSLGELGFKGLSYLLRRADGVVANSKATLESAEMFIAKGAYRAVIVSPIGIVAARSPLRTLGPVRRIGMVARIDDWKGQDVLVRAFAARFAHTEMRLVLIGGASFGKERVLDSLRQLVAELGIARQVDIVGHVDDVSARLLDLDICVQASTRAEPLGQNVLQYLAAGKPTVAVDAGGPAEWIESGRNGLLVPMGNVDALAQALEELVRSPHLRFDLATGAARTPGLPTDRSVAEAHAELYRTVLDRRSARRRDAA